MSFSLHIATSDEVRSNLLAMHFLNEAAAEYGGMHDVAQTLHNNGNGQVFIVLVKFETLLRGLFTFVLSQQAKGRVMTLTLLGGYDLNQWSDLMRKFLYKSAKELDCDYFYYMGRKGFSRIFPELEEVCRVYRKILKEPDGNIK